MITTFLAILLNTVFDFLQGFFTLFPQMPEEMTDIEDIATGQMFGEVMGWVNYFLPLDVASGIVAVWATAMMAYVGLKLAMKYAGELK